jgi:hypothetical protein
MRRQITKNWVLPTTLDPPPPRWRDDRDKKAVAQWALRVIHEEDEAYIADATSFPPKTSAPPPWETDALID